MEVARMIHHREHREHRGLEKIDSYSRNQTSLDGTG
jgi:hypothetical protein